MKELEELKALVDSAYADADKQFSKGNSAAGVRLRKVMQNVKAKAQQIRQVSQTFVAKAKA